MCLTTKEAHQLVHIWEGLPDSRLRQIQTRALIPSPFVGANGQRKTWAIFLASSSWVGGRELKTNNVLLRKCNNGPGHSTQVDTWGANYNNKYTCRANAMLIADE